MNSDPIIALIAAIVGSFVLVLILAQTTLGRIIRTPLVLTLVIHLLAAGIILAAYQLVAPDAETYDVLARALSQLWAGETSSVPLMTGGKEGFPILLAVLYSVFGYAPFLGLVVNATACVVTVFALAATAERVGGSPLVVSWIGALFPPFVLWGSLLLRESLTWMLLASAAYAVVSLTSTLSPRYWVLLGITLACLLWIRGTAAVIVGASMLLALVLARKRQTVMVVIATVVAALAAGPLSTRLDEVTGTYTIEQINLSREALAREASVGSFPIAGFGDPVSLITSIPQVVPRVLFGPYPWEWASTGMIFGLDAILWLLLLGFVIRGYFRCAAKRTLLSLIVPAFVLLVVLAVTSGNYGTMQRLRVQAAVLLAPIASIGWTKPSSERSRRANVIGELNEG